LAAFRFASKALSQQRTTPQQEQQPQQQSAQLARLTHFLIAKSIIEALFVGALAVGFYLTAFIPYLRGSVDEASPRAVRGWTVNEADQQLRVEVQLYIDGRFVASQRADQSRPDVRDAGRAADEWHGYLFQTPPLEAGEHEARIYAVHGITGDQLRTLHLIGIPHRFRVEGEGAKPLSGAAVLPSELR
jgi:hypothetical protein